MVAAGASGASGRRRPAGARTPVAIPAVANASIPGTAEVHYGATGGPRPLRAGAHRTAGGRCRADRHAAGRGARPRTGSGAAAPPLAPRGRPGRDRAARRRAARARSPVGARGVRAGRGGRPGPAGALIHRRPAQRRPAQRCSAQRCPARGLPSTGRWSGPTRGWHPSWPRSTTGATPSSCGGPTRPRGGRSSW